MKTLKKWSAESVEFGESVRRRRKALGLSQEDLAAKSGMHPTYLSGIENGARNPTLKTICALASALEELCLCLALFPGLPRFLFFSLHSVCVLY